MNTFDSIAKGREFEWVKTGEVSIKVGFDIFYDPTEDELVLISGSNLYKPNEEVKLFDSCEHCKHYEKIEDHMYKFDGTIGCERYDDFCNKWDRAIGDSARHPEQFEDVSANTFRCEQWREK